MNPKRSVEAVVHNLKTHAKTCQQIVGEFIGLNK